MPRRYQRKRTAGYRLPEGVQCVTRPHQFGNPWIVGSWIAQPIEDGRAWNEVEVTPELAVALYRAWLAMPEQADLVATVRVELAGSDLACYCGESDPCHADVLLEIANA
jgi:hypothetical protein